MTSRRAAIVLTALALAGCMGEDDGDSAPAQSAQAVFTEFVHASREGGRDVRQARLHMWRLLSERTKTEYIIRRDGWLLGVGGRMQEDLLPLVGRPVTAFEEPDGRWAVATVVDKHRTRTYAAPLVLQDREWRIEPWSSIRLYRPKPSRIATSSQPNVDVEIVVAPLALKVKVGRIWIDGEPIEARVRKARGRLSLLGRPEAPLSAGRHSALVLVRAGEEASALAWTFAVRARGA